MRFFLYPTTFFTPAPIVNIANAVTPAIASDIIVRALTIALNPPILPPPVVTQPAYFVQQLDAQVVKPLAAAEQQFSAFAPVPPVKPVEGWRGPQLDQKLATPLPAQEQQWSGFEPAGFIQTTLPDGWRGLQLETKFTAPLPPAQQQWASFEPAGFIQSTFPDGWRGLQLEARTVLPLPAAQQQWTGFQPFTTTVVYPDGWRGLQLDSKTATPLPASQQQWSGFEPAGFIQTTLPDGWRGLQLEARLVQPLASSQQQWASFEPAGFIKTTLPDGWRGLQLETAFVKPLAPAQQQWAAFQPTGGTVVYPDGWRGLQLDAKLATPFPVALQQYAGLYPPQGSVPTATTPHGWEGIQLDRKIAIPFPAAEQQWGAFQPAGSIAATPAFPDGWRGLQLDTRLGTPLAAAQQQWASFEPQGAIFSTIPQGFWGWQLDARTTAPFAASEQQFLAFGTPPLAYAVAAVSFGDVAAARITIAIDQEVIGPLTTAVVYPDGWRGLQLESRLAKPLSTAEQQWAGFEPAGFIQSTFPDGWRGLQLDARQVPPISAAQQQWASFARGTIGVFPDGWRGLQLDAKLATPYPVTQQQYAGLYPPQGNVPTATTAHGWEGIQLENRFAKPVAAAVQQWATFTPLPTTTAAVIYEGWRGIQLDARFATPFPIVEQQWATFIAAPLLYSLAIVQSGDVSAPLITIAIDQTVISPLTTTVVTFKDGWRGLQLDTKFANLFPVSEQQWGTFTPLPPTPPAAAIYAGSSWGSSDVFVDTLVIATNQPLVPRAIPSVTPQRSWNWQLDSRLAAPFPATEQQWGTFTPKPPPVVAAATYTGGAWDSSDIFIDSLVIATNQPTIPPLVTTAAAVYTGGAWDSSDVFIDTLVIATNQPLIPAPPVVYALATVQSGDVSAPLITIAIDQEVIGPLSTVVPPFRDGWGLQLDVRFAKPFPIAEQQLATFVSVPVVYALATISSGDVTAALRTIAIDQPTIPPLTTKIFKDGWRGLPEPQLAKPFPAAAQQFLDSFTPQGNIPTAKTAHGWEGIQLDSRLATPFPIALQQYALLYPPQGNVPSPPIVHGAIRSDPVIVSYGYVVEFDGSGAFAPTFTPPSSFAKWGWQLDSHFANPFPVADQQFTAPFTPRGNIPTATTPHGWEGWQLEKLAKPFPVALQQYAAPYPPEGTVTTAAAPPFALRQDPLIVSYGYVVEFEGNGGFAPSFAARPGFTSRWDLDFRFAKPFPVVDQLWSTSLAPVGTVPTAKTAHGWESWQLNAQLAKSFPIVAQQFVSSFTPRGMVPTGASPHGWEGWQLNIRFAQPFPIHDQQFVSWPAELVPPFSPPGSGRRYKPPTEYLLTVPPAWDVKQRKPIKPIWDRGGKVEKPQEPPKPRTPPPVPASIFEPEPAPPSLTSLPTFGQYTIDRPLKLAEHLKNVRLHTAYDRDEQAMVLILDRLADEENEEEEE